MHTYKEKARVVVVPAAKPETNIDSRHVFQHNFASSWRTVITWDSSVVLETDLVLVVVATTLMPFCYTTPLSPAVVAS